MTVVGDFSVRGGIKTMVTAEYRGVPESIPTRPDATRVPDVTHVPIEAELDLHAFAPRDIAVGGRRIRDRRRGGRDSARCASSTAAGAACSAGSCRRRSTAIPCVEEFWDDTASHLGATLVRLIQK